MRSVSGAVLLLFMAQSVFSYTAPEVKEKVGQVITALEQKSARCGSLDAFGMASIKESKEIIEIGGSAVYVLSLYTRHRDWKVRFWVADILGYLKNEDAQRPLTRMIKRQGEHRMVRAQALKSLKKLGLATNIKN